MLRNRNQVPTEHRNVEILNEVLSLNAQEFCFWNVAYFVLYPQ